MCFRVVYLSIELKATLLNIGLLSGALALLSQKCRRELDAQVDEIHAHTNYHGKEIGASFQNANSNLNFNKTLQWNYIYYAILLYGPIVGLAITNSQNPLLQMILAIATNLVFSVGLYLTIDAQFQIRRERLSIISIQILLLEKKHKKKLAELNESKNLALKFLSHPYITLTVIGAMAAGYLICLFITISNTIKY